MVIASAVITMGTGRTQHYAPGSIRTIEKPAECAPFPGFIFPYFKEMLVADPDTPFQNFLRLYHHCFADDASEAGGNAELLRRGFRFLSSTPAGRVIQHVYFGINLCIDMGGRLHIIKDGSDYAGFAIEGENLSVLVRNRIKNSYQPDDIRVALESLSSHSAAVRKIYDILVAVGRVDGGEEQRTFEECVQNPRVIREMILARGAKDMNALRETLGERIGELKYRQTYWEDTSENLLKFIQKLTHGASMMNEPMYVHIDVMMNRSSNLLEYLSVFGSQAPSLYYGDTVKQIAATGKDDPNLRLINGKRALPYIPYVKKGLIAAAMDWATVHRSHAIKFQGPRGKIGPNAPFADKKARTGLITAPQFDDFYSLLRLWSFSESNDDASGSSKKAGKRKQVDDDADMAEGSSSKKPKMQYTFL